MSAKPAEKLSRREREIMDLLYAREQPSTAEDVRGGLVEPPSYSAVRAMLAKLEAKGYVRHREEGLRYVYAPTTPPRPTHHLRSRSTRVRTRYGVTLLDLRLQRARGRAVVGGREALSAGRARSDCHTPRASHRGSGPTLCARPGPEPLLRLSPRSGAHYQRGVRRQQLQVGGWWLSLVVGRSGAICLGAHRAASCSPRRHSPTARRR
jgi:hypothetical protein